MNTVPIIEAARSEMKAPINIELQTVRRADGLSCFTPWLYRHLVRFPVFLHFPLVSMH